MSLDKIDRPVLYSTITFLAYNISKQYYGDLHYMWCTPYFGTDYNSPTFTVPPSSSPLDIYNTLRREIEGGDLHDTLIRIKRLGVRRGADAMEKRGKITSQEAQEIRAICKLSPREHFRPLMCVIPRTSAIPYCTAIDIKAKANPLSHEYVIADIPGNDFDVIRIG